MPISYTGMLYNNRHGISVASLPTEFKLPTFLLREVIRIFLLNIRNTFLLHSRHADGGERCMQRYVLIPKSQREGRSSFTGKEEIISPVLPHSWLHPYRESGAPFVSYPLTALYRKEFPLHSTCLSKLPSQEFHRFHYQSTDGIDTAFDTFSVFIESLITRPPIQCQIRLSYSQ